MSYLTLLLKNETNPRTYKQSEVRFFTPEQLFDTEIDDNVLYINADMVKWVREATSIETRERMQKGRTW